MRVLFQCGTCTGKGSAVHFQADINTSKCPACGSSSISPAAVPDNTAPKASPVAPDASGGPGEIWESGIVLLAFKRNAENGQFEACGQLCHMEDHQLGPALYSEHGAGTYHVRWCHPIDGILRSETIDVPELGRPVTIEELQEMADEGHRQDPLEELLQLARGLFELGDKIGQRALEQLENPEPRPDLVLLERIANRLDQVAVLLGDVVQFLDRQSTTTTSPAPDAE